MSSRLSGLVLGSVLCLAVFGSMYFLVGNNRKPVVDEPSGKAPSAVADNASPIAGEPKVKLAVLVVFDQMRGDYIDRRWSELFSQGGFKRMQREGIHFTHCYYPYGITSTGPGHASILSGTSAHRHGITNNEWFDRNSGTLFYCAGSQRYEFVPPKPPPKTKPTTPPNVGNPDRLMSPTVADVLKLATQGKGKVFGLSLKDRSAILPTGHRPDGAYWFDGRFITSTYYRDSVHPWVAEFNRSKQADAWFEKPWTKIRSDIDYVQYSGPDDMLGESKSNGRGTSFPHIMTGGKKELGSDYYNALVNSPYGNELLLAFAKNCIISEGLGTHDVPDLLTISFSSNDIIGHAYGPDSQEVMDVTLRSDAIMADLLAFLDEKVGKDKYALCLTADHGVCPLPELSAAVGLDAKRVSTVSLMLGAERHLQSRFGKLDGDFETAEKSKRTTWIETISPPWLYVNERLCAVKGVKKEAVAAEYVAWLKQQPDIENAYTAEQLQKPDTLDEIGKRMALSYYLNRSGDLAVVLKPFYLVEEKISQAGTSHGTPFDYDRHVPLMVFGPGLKPGRVEEAVAPQHAASVLSYYLGLTPPKDNEFELPKAIQK
ncbi:MAG: alkaline phosphatase family protein [Gemmataceae bacterium]